EHVRIVWPLLARWAQPADALAAEAELVEIGRWIQREQRARRLLELARAAVDGPDRLDGDEGDRGVTGIEESVLDLAVLVVPVRGEDDSEEPVLVTKGVLRVAARFTGETVDRRNRLTDGRLAVARMIGDDSDARRAHL